MNPKILLFTFDPATLSIAWNSTVDTTITAPTGYASYQWKLNGSILALQTTEVCTINLSTGEAKDFYIMGTNTLSLIVQKDGAYYSGSYSFEVTSQ